MSSSSSLAELRILLQKFYKVAVKLDEDQQASLLAMFYDAYNNVIQNFDIDEAELLEEDSPDTTQDDAVEDESEVEDDVQDTSYAQDAAVEVEQKYDYSADAIYDGQEADEVEGKVQDDEDNLTITPQDLERFKEVELFLGEKLYLQGKAATEVFTRFDTVGTGCVTVEEFRAAIALLGVALLDDEVRVFKKKFASMNHPGMIDYQTFMRYVDALRTRRPRDLTTTAIARRPVMTPEATRALLAKVKVPLLTRLQRGLKLVREHLYVHSKVIGQVYKALKNERGAVEISTLVKNLTSYGFPKDLVADAELSAYLRETAGVDGDLSYNDFARLMQGHPEVAEPEDPSPRNLLTDPTFISVLVKLNSLQLRAHFKQIDTDMDDQISVQEVINDLGALGLTKEICKLPELTELVERFSARRPGYLQYSEYLQFVNARVGNLPPAVQASVHVEIPATATLEELVDTLHTHTKKGISLDSVFAQFAPLRSRAITETDLWHALAMIGFIVPKELNQQFFDLFAPLEGVDGPAIDYKDVSLTVLHPSRNPRLSHPSGSSSGAHAGDAIPLGSAVSNVHEFAIASNAAAAASAARKVGRVAGAETHRQGSQVFGEPASSDLTKSTGSLQSDDDVAGPEVRSALPPGSRKLGQNTRSSVKFGDLTEEEIAAQSTRNANRHSEAAARMNIHNKGHIDFAGDHGAKVPVPRVQSSRAAQTTVNLSSEQTEFERSKQAADLAERQRTAPSHKTASDIFNTRNAASSEATTKPPGPISNISFDYSDVQKERTPEASAAAAVAAAARPRSAMSLALEHDESQPAPAAASVTGLARRGAGLGARGTLDLSFDPEASAAAAAPKSGRRTYEDHVGARDHIESLHEEQTLEEQLQHQVEMQQEAQRRARASGANKPIPKGPPYASQSSAETDDLIADLDRRVLSPRIKTPATSRVAGSDAEVEAEPQQLNHAYLQTLSREIYTKGKVRSVFSEWAQGGTSLTKEQLASGAAKLLYPVPEGQLDLIFATYDREGKGTLGYADFMRMLSARQ